MGLQDDGRRASATPPDKPARIRDLARVLRHRDFRLLWLATDVGLVLAAHVIPLIGFLVIGGVGGSLLALGCLALGLLPRATRMLEAPPRVQPNSGVPASRVEASA